MRGAPGSSGLPAQTSHKWDKPKQGWGGPTLIRHRRTRLSLNTSGKSRRKVGNHFRSCRESSVGSVCAPFRAETRTEFPLEFDSEADLKRERRRGHLTGVQRSRHQPEQVLRQLEDLPLAPFPAAHRRSDGSQVEIRTPLRSEGGGGFSLENSGRCVLLRRRGPRSQ